MAPFPELREFDLDSFARAHRGTISLIFAASVFLLGSYPFSVATEWATGRIKSHGFRRMVKRNMQNLGKDEIALLLP